MVDRVRQLIGRRRATTPIGLDVGARLIKVIQLDAGPSGLRVAAAAVVPRAAGAATAMLTPQESAALPATLGRAGFTGRRTVLAAPPDRLMQSVLDLPPRNGPAPIEQLARVELARVNKCAPDSFEFGMWELPGATRAKRRTHVMATGLPHACAEAQLDALQPSGLRADSLDVTACALARAATAAQALAGKDAEGMTAILDLGWGSPALSVLYQGTLVFNRALADAGVGRLHAALTARLGLEAEVADFLLAEVGLRAGAREGEAGDEASSEIELTDDARGALANHVDAIARELGLSFAYAAQQFPDAEVSSLLLTGGGATIPGLAARLATALGVTVRPLAPTDLASCDASLATLCGSPVLTAAAGLALFAEW